MKQKIINIKLLITVVISLIFCTVSYAQSASYDISGMEILQKSEDVISFKNTQMIITLRIYNPSGGERVRILSSRSMEFGKVSKMLIRFLEPADCKGTAMLIHDYTDKSDDMWIYLPAIRKTRRIASSEKGNNFMGSEFSNADMSKPALNNFSCKILGSEKYNGLDCWKIESIPNDSNIASEYGFSRKISLIEKSSYLCHKAMLYDHKGILAKTQLITQYRKISETRYLARRMEMINEQNGRRSTISIDDFREDVMLPESEFSPSKLE